jgi:hypothetical protein
MSKENLPAIVCQEECAEVIQSISKVFRFGLDTEYGNRQSNKRHLEEELGQLAFSIERITELWGLDEDAMSAAYYNKKETFKQWEEYFPQTPL